MTCRAGLGLVELMVAMVLTAIVATAALRLLLAQQHTARTADHRLRLNATLRMVAGFLPVELRELSTSGPVSDIVALTPMSIVYRAPRGLRFLCRPADAGAGRLVLDAARTFGFRGADPARDSLLLFVEGDSSTASDGRWARADLLSVASADCPGGAAGVAYRVSGPPVRLEVGTPVRSFETTELRLYADGGGARWLGLRTARKAGGWNRTQPVVGPLGVDGMFLMGWDSTGSPTADPRSIVRIGATFVGPPEAPFPLQAVVTLRNAVR